MFCLLISSERALELLSGATLPLHASLAPEALKDAGQAISHLSGGALSSGSGGEIAVTCFDLATALWQICPGVLLVRGPKRSQKHTRRLELTSCVLSRPQGTNALQPMLEATLWAAVAPEPECAAAALRLAAAVFSGASGHGDELARASAARAAAEHYGAWMHVQQRVVSDPGFARSHLPFPAAP